MRRWLTCGQETARISAHAVGAEALCPVHFSMCWLVVHPPRPHILPCLIPGLPEMHGAGREGAALKAWFTTAEVSGQGLYRPGASA